MMNLNDLLETYHHSPRLKALAERVAYDKPQRIYLDNLQGSSFGFVFSAVFSNENAANLNHIVILNNAEEAAYFQNTLENITGALDILYFPSSFKTGKNFRMLNPSHVMLRTEALTKMASRTMESGAPTAIRKKVLITYPEALFEKVVLAKTLSSNIIHIKTNDTLNIDGLLELFVMYGFERVDFVYEPGQFAIRGGILDIYSFGNEKPYRIELFGNEVDSIRVFDPESQLSERKLLHVSIIPNIETQFDSGEKVSLLEFLPTNTIVWVKNWEIIDKTIREQEADLDKFLQKGGQEESLTVQEEDDIRVLRNVDKNDFLPISKLLPLILDRHIIEFGRQPFFFDKNKKNASQNELAIEGLFTFQTKQQPSFNRQFKLLIDNIKEFQEQGYRIFIFADQPKQLERLHSIFTDLGTEIEFVQVPVSISEGFTDSELKIVCYTDHQIFQRYNKYKVKQAFSKNKALTLKALSELHPGDFVTHIDHGIGRYSGLEKMEVGGKVQEVVRIVYKDSDVLYVHINSLHKISKYTGKEGSVPRINKLGSDTWAKLKDKTKQKVKEVAFDLIKLYAQRKAQKGFAHSPDSYLQTELEASFIYEDTPDQSKATADVKKDMESESPMDRLVCGDVGFGKTEVAIRAAFKSCTDGKQAVVLVPTTILAFQHYKTFKERLKDFPVTVDFINRFKTPKEKKATLEKVSEGKVDILIGTHGILGKEVKFKNLGIMIIDEEQKFGVGHKEKLKTLKTNVDCLTLTATPIPRTLQFSLMGARDLSIINTPPPNRQPIQTEVINFQEDVIRDAINFETERGGQVFFIHNRVQGLNEMSAFIQGLCPNLSVGTAHGQLEGDLLEERILDFIDRKYDVMVCTNIVESGVDIPNVNTIIINNAHQFGLSDLHQLRGRVGRSNKKAFCYLMAPMATLPNDSRKRLQTLEQFSDLGSGFQIAMRDLDIRGAGNMLGGEQSGFIAEIGFEMYQKILNEAIRELKRSDFHDVFKEEISKQDDFVQDCTIDTDIEILIPDSYVANIGERMVLYTRLDNCENDEELGKMRQELIDRFGPMSQQVEDLFTTVQCRRLGVSLGFEKMSLKDKVLKCYFINKNDSPYFDSNLFNNIKEYLLKGTNKGTFKQTGKNFLLLVEDIASMKQMWRFLDAMAKEVLG